jgi:hypothetical protein
MNNILPTLTIEALVGDWQRAKEMERIATEHRRAVEDELAKRMELPADLDGVRALKVGDLDVKVTGRINRKVDADEVQKLAAAAGLEAHLSSLFRWKPEINLSAWKAADPAITTPLLGAITSEPGRPSFAVTSKKKEST